MKANELYEKFLRCCKEYSMEYGNIILKNNENMFILFKSSKDVEYIAYEIRIGSSRESGYACDMNKLIYLASTTVGSDKINLSNEVVVEKTKVKQIQYSNHFYM